MFLYPRLSRSVARNLLGELEVAVNDDSRQVEDLVALDHPRAGPAPTGGPVADPDRIRHIRDRVLDEMSQWMDRPEVPRKNVGDFDRQLGRALHQELKILPADAAHEGPWSFLTLVVFPDLAYHRFPDLHPDRMLGTPRNTLRKPWIRQEILGDLLHRGDPPLGEDELVGIFERTSMVRNRRLTRALVKEVLAYDGASARSEFARDLYKRVRYSTGPLLLDVLDDTALQDHVSSLAQSI